MAAVEQIFFEGSDDETQDSRPGLWRQVTWLSWPLKLLLAVALIGVGFAGAAAAEGYLGGLWPWRQHSGWLDTGSNDLRVFLPLPGEARLRRDAGRVDLWLGESGAVIQSQLGGRGQHLALRTPHASIYAGDAVLAAMVDEDRTHLQVRRGQVALLDQRGQLQLVEAPRAVTTGRGGDASPAGPSPLLSFLDLLFPDPKALEPPAKVAPASAAPAERSHRAATPPAARSGRAPGLLPRKAPAAPAATTLPLVQARTAFDDAPPPLVEAPLSEAPAPFVPWEAPE